MANLISVSVLKYGHEEFGTTKAAAKTMLLSTEHIIYGTNVETLMDVTLTGGAGASNTFTFSGQTGLTAGDYVRVGNVGNAVATMDVLSADLIAGTIFKIKDINGGSNPTMSMDESGTTATTQNSESGLALEAYQVQGELLYADTQNNGRPIVIRTVEPCVNMTDGRGVSSKSNQLRAVEINSKNGVVYDADTISEVNLMINTDRVIMTYEGAIAAGAATDRLGTLAGGASADDWATWYDASNTNCAGMDSPHCDILNVETSLDALKTSFLQHLGGLTVSDMATLTVNGNVVAFPDTSVSGLVRCKNIICGHDSRAVVVGPGDGAALVADKAQIKLKTYGKPGYDTLALDETITVAVASTMEDHVIS